MKYLIRHPDAFFSVIWTNTRERAVELVDIKNKTAEAPLWEVFELVAVTA